jgi:hypothetical protein
VDPALAAVFANAAAPQKLVFAAMAIATIAAVVAAVSGRGPPRILRELRLVAPALGLACAALNGLHMMQTTLRLLEPPTARLLAPGVMEMAALVGAGALAGLAAVIAAGRLEARRWTSA